MPLIDRYILKKFLSAFFFVVLILMAIIVVIDITEKNDEFIKQAVPFAEILQYYFDFIPFVSSLITPITVFIATVFVTAKMASHTEIVAILSSGVSFQRMLLPYLMGAVLIGGISFYLTGWVIPNSNKSRLAFEAKYIDKPFSFNERNIHIKVGPETYLYMQSYNNQTDIGEKFTLETIQGTELIEKLTASRIEWQEDSGTWLIKNWQLRKFSDIEEEVSMGKTLDTTLAIRPKDFKSDHRLYETLTIDELNDYIAELESRGADNAEIYYIEKYMRFTSPFSMLILTFMGVIVSARKTRGGAGFQIALGFLFAFIFIIFFIMSKSIAETGSLDPLVAVWMPNIIFSIVGLVMYKLVPR